MGYIRGLLHGAAIGTVVGLCLAPQTGDKTRAQLNAVYRATRSGYTQAERMVRGLSSHSRHEEPTLTSVVHNGHR